MKVLLALAVLVSVLLVSLASYRAHHHPRIVRSQETALHPLRIVRSPQAPKIVRPVHPATEPVSNPVPHLIRRAAHQHKA